MKLLDLFCGAGGAGEGYRRAGFDVTGVDNRPMPRNPHRFIQADALEYLAEHGHEYDAIHASPPCQAYSVASVSQRKAGKRYPDLLAKTRELLIASGKLFAIENVPGAPMRADAILCGSMFGLRVIRHRMFEMNLNRLILTPTCQHHENPVCVVGHGTPSWNLERNGMVCHTADERRAAMGIDWMDGATLSQAIPPAYTEFIGRELLKA